LSPYRLAKARDLYNIFNVFNSLSWQFLVGNIITLFAMRLKASSTYIGLINAMLYVAFFFLPLGKILAARFSIIRIFSFAWIFRSLGMAPLLFAPFIFASGNRDTALALMMLGVGLFHICRGVGMIGNNPVLSNLASGPDRGSYMTQIQIINSAIGMFAGFIIALLLGRDPPLYLYTVIMVFGIGSGIVSGILMGKIPEPPVEAGEKKIHLFKLIRDTFSQDALKRFLIIFFGMALVSGVSRAFVIVYSREVFSQSDGMVSLYAVFGGLGQLMAGMLIKFLVDRIGAKPIFIICGFIGFVSMLPVIFFPMSLADNFTTVTLFLTFLFFTLNFGFLGAEGIAQTYFLGLIPQEKMMDMGILYFFFFGISGSLGAFSGGLFLDILQIFGLSTIVSFKVLFILLAGISVAVLILQRKLVPLGALPMKGALEVIFSFRDLRAITLLDKLNKTSDSQEEAALLEALHDTPSRLAVKGLLARAKSPRLAIRLESIRAMETLDTLTEDAEKALMNDIVNNPFTTAYISARILGNHGVFAAAPLLRELALSGDYMLAGEAVIALAKLRDNGFRPQIEEIILKTQNPRLKIMGVQAFGIYGSPDSLSVLLDILRDADPPPYLRDEVVLAMANILDIQNQFYPHLVRFLGNETLLETLALDEAESALEFFHSTLGKGRGRKSPRLTFISRQAKTIVPAALALVQKSRGEALSRWLMELPSEITHTVAQVVLSEALLDDDLASHRRLKLLTVQWAAHELRQWTKQMKGSMSNYQ
jgi:MFS family permease/HEAT repeat protein